MRDGVVDIEIGQEVLLLGRLSARFGVPRELREPRRALMVLPRLAFMPSAMRQLRSYWADEWSTQAVVNLSDHDVVRVVGGAIETGQLQAAVLPRIVPGQLTETETPVNRARTAPTARIAPAVPPARAIERSPPSGAPVASPLPGVVTPAHALPVARWPLEQRVAEVIRRTIPKVPSDIGATLLSLLSPESLAIVAGTMVFSAAANLTPYGWAADAVIVGIAFGFGGVAAIHALGDLVECFKLTVGATSEQDLDAAADALARAVVGLGVVAMMVVLHRVAARKGGGGPPSGGGSAGQAGEQAMQREMAAARAERLKARLEAHQEKAKVTVYRVEGAGNQRLVIGADGSVDIPEVLTKKGSERNLYLNFGDEARAQEFLQQRLAQFPDNTIKTFEVPKSFVDELRSKAVPEAERSLSPDRPVIADPTKATDQFGLSGEQIDQLRKVIIPGSGKPGG